MAASDEEVEMMEVSNENEPVVVKEKTKKESKPVHELPW